MQRYEFSTLLWNVCTGAGAEAREETSWITRGPRVLKLLENNTADIMCLVELSRSGLKNGSSGLSIYDIAAPFKNHHLVFRSYGGFSLGTLVNVKKFAIGDVRVRDIAEDGNNIVMFVDLRHKRTNLEMTLAVTHLPAKYAHKQEALEQFIEHVNCIDENRKLLVCGDFNIDGAENYDALETAFLNDVSICSRDIAAKIDDPQSSEGPMSIASEVLKGTYLGFREINRGWRTLENAGGFDIIATRGIESQVPETPDFMKYEYGDTCETYTYPSDHLALRCRMFIRA